MLSKEAMRMTCLFEFAMAFKLAISLTFSLTSNLPSVSASLHRTNFYSFSYGIKFFLRVDRQLVICPELPQSLSSAPHFSII